MRGQDSNLRPPGYEPDELPDCSTPQENDSTARTSCPGQPELTLARHLAELHEGTDNHKNWCQHFQDFHSPARGFVNHSYDSRSTNTDIGRYCVNLIRNEIDLVGERFDLGRQLLDLLGKFGKKEDQVAENNNQDDKEDTTKNANYSDEDEFYSDDEVTLKGNK